MFSDDQFKNLFANNLSQAGSKRARNLPLGSGSGSDVDTAAGSGAEMSESGKSKKLKLNHRNNASRSGTPSGSRAASPVAGNRSFSGSRASSPDGGRGKLLPSLHFDTNRRLIELQAPAVHQPPTHLAKAATQPTPKSTLPSQQRVSEVVKFFASSATVSEKTTSDLLTSLRKLVSTVLTSCCDLVRGGRSGTKQSEMGFYVIYFISRFSAESLLTG